MEILENDFHIAEHVLLPVKDARGAWSAVIDKGMISTTSSLSRLPYYDLFAVARRTKMGLYNRSVTLPLCSIVVSIN
jgi:hypothetical protein